MKRLFACLFIAALPIAAQDRDFLTPNEVDQIREAQEPNDRLTLYLHFATERLDLMKQYLAKDKTGRSLFVHNAIEDYNSIIEAIDSVSDDALKRHAPIDKGTIAVINAEKGFLDTLNKIRDNPQSDYNRYKFVLEQAIATTSDSRDLAMEDSQKRSTEVIAADEKEKKDREANMASSEVKDRKKQAQGIADDKAQKKVPSLYRPGEKPANPQP